MSIDRCISCDWKSEHRDVVYDAKLNVVVTGVLVRSCERCGCEERRYENVSELERRVFLAIAHRSGRLSGPELRNLRLALGKSAKALAEEVDIAAETLSRWETGSLQADMKFEAGLRLDVDAALGPRGAEHLGFRAAMKLAMRERDSGPIRVAASESVQSSVLCASQHEQLVA